MTKSANKTQKLENNLYKEAVIMKLVPLGDRVVLKQLVAEETTKSGIVLPGPGGVIDGKEVKMEVKAGDQVIYSKYAGTEVKLEDEEYIVVKQSDIVAIIEA